MDFRNVHPLSPHLPDSPLLPTTLEREFFPIDEEMEAMWSLYSSDIIYISLPFAVKSYVNPILFF